jgi:hypothetical protein
MRAPSLADNSAEFLGARAGDLSPELQFMRARPFIAQMRAYLRRAEDRRKNLEDVMRFTKSSAFALALCVVGASAAFANEKDTQASCMAAGSEVSTALNGSAQNADEARHEKKLGFEACNAGFYHQGMVHYAKAMELLGLKS